ncbi:magnesium chelatase domain-containing protein [Sphingomicrobium lutaoense]|uniref:magnesium chelatase domain-containing protein n=1 Tax=Sphingomicrobium lutaoense TaxID=515949 RepID=UPI001608664A|nr:magnesium chelatase domain-containing protein [Sphingomicrobium lutaoense]
MVATVITVAYLGLEARSVEGQVQLSSGLPAFVIVGLPDKAVAESRERVRAALTVVGLAFAPKRIVVNLSPADLPKEGSGAKLLPEAAGAMRLSPRAYRRLLKGRTIAELAGVETVGRIHAAEALSYRHQPPRNGRASYGGRGAEDCIAAHASLTAGALVLPPWRNW